MCGDIGDVNGGSLLRCQRLGVQAKRSWRFLFPAKVKMEVEAPYDVNSRVVPIMTIGVLGKELLENENIVDRS